MYIFHYRIAIENTYSLNPQECKSVTVVVNYWTILTLDMYLRTEGLLVMCIFFEFTYSFIIFEMNLEAKTLFGF